MQFSMVLAERARMAREIHDTLLQSLVGTALQLDNISAEIDSAPAAAKEELLQVRRQVERYVGEANQSIWELRSPMLTSRDLPTALREAAEAILVSTAAELKLLVLGHRRRCPPAIEQQLLRITQEAVTNASRHGRASRIQVELSYGSESISVRITDNGCGFDPAATGHDVTAGHWGLTIMRERIQQIGGRITVVSSAKTGTTIEVIAPCPRTTTER